MFEWDEKLSVDLPIINDQHQQLFRIGNNLFKMIESDDGIEKIDTLMIGICELIDYTLYHFSEEEMIMHNTNYPSLHEHISEHNTFRAYIEDLNLKDIEYHTDATLHEIIKFIATWIYKHISQTDSQCGDYVKEQFCEDTRLKIDAKFKVTKNEIE